MELLRGTPSPGVILAVTEVVNSCLSEFRAATMDPSSLSKLITSFSPSTSSTTAGPLPFLPFTDGSVG